MADTVTVRYLGPNGCLIVDDHEMPQGVLVTNVPTSVVERVHEHLPGHRLEVIAQDKAATTPKAATTETPAPPIRE